MVETAPEIDQFPRVSAGALLLWLQLPLLVLVLWFAGQWVTQWLDQPLQDVDVQGAFQQTDAKSLRLSVWESVKGTYLELDLQAIKTTLEQQPWVYQVDVQRQWPAGLAIDIVEQKPIARWGDDGFLNSEGVAFYPPMKESVAGLPVLIGPDAHSLEMMEEFRTMSELLRPLELKIGEMLLEDRGAWTLTFLNGTQLLLGRGNIVEKLRRFSRVYGAELMPHKDKIAKVDARYTNGLSVTWKEGVLPAKSLDVGKLRG